MDFVSLELKGNIGIVTVKRPPVNAITKEMYQAIQNAFETISARKEIHVALFRGEGKFFSAGNDVNEFLSWNPDNVEENLGVVTRSITAVAECRVPVIGVMNGHAHGAGCSYASRCDILLAAEGTKFSIPEVKIGIIGGARNLSRLLPHKLVRYLALTGNPISAERLKELGGILEVLPKDKLMDKAMELAHDIASKSPYAIELFKKSLNTYDFTDLTEAPDMALTRKLLAHPDAKESVQAFLEKRKPKFCG